jgi:hypothetical protein
MGRKYKVTFGDVAVSAAQDLLQIKGATNKTLRIIRAWWGCTNTTLATSQSVSTRCRFLPSIVTDGSGGSTPTPRVVDPGDAAATFTARANNTAKATSSGTAAVIEESGDHLYNGYRSQWDDKGCPIVPPSTSFVMELLSTVSGPVSMSGGAEVEEIG